ncbi:hypothetical protein AN191_03400 [Loktanella sp. 5RATIMAR09]|nr:hypothetical protein AN191_03400 [Loktanella sp. 5RATIMAR09]
MAGGNSERFGGIGACPKPAIEIAGLPLVLHAAAKLVHAGCQRIIVLTGENHDQLQYRLGLSSRFGRLELGGTAHVSFELRFSGINVATGGRLARLQKQELGDNALLSYTDVFSDCDLGELISLRRQAKAGLAVLAVNPRQPWGLITMDHNRITAFSEKPVADNQWINGGFFALDASILDAIQQPEDRLEDQVIERMIAQNTAVALPHKGWWRSIDSPKDVQLALKKDFARFDFQNGKQPQLSSIAPPAKSHRSEKRGKI